MKTHLNTTLGVVLGAMLSFASLIPANAALSDYQNQLYANDFSSGTDAGWTHDSGFALSTLQTWNASTFAYQLTAIANGYNPGNGKYGYVGSRVTALNIGDGYVQSDVVTWQGPGIFGAWGVGSRLSNFGVPLDLRGYAVVYEPYGASGAGDMRLEKLGQAFGIFSSLGSSNVTLLPGNQYTLTLETSGTSIVGSIWNIGQVGISLVGQISATDSSYASGAVALIGVNQQPMPTVDTTWDNFKVMVPEPGSGLLFGLGLLGVLAKRRSSSKRS